jgi:hypothetical protein
MTESQEEKRCCKDFRKFGVCVVTKADMDKKIINLYGFGEDDRFFENTPDLTKHLNKKGVPNWEKKQALEFVNSQFRSLKKLDESTKVNPHALGLGLGIGKDKNKEV